MSVTYPKKKTLSPREIEALELLIQGMTNLSIANKLFVTEDTVKNYLSIIYYKMGVKNRVEAALKYKEGKNDTNCSIRSRCPCWDCPYLHSS